MLTPQPGPVDPSQVRASDADRHRVAELLRDAAGEGRIDFAELDERLEATYAAKTYADLLPITADLPVRQVGLPPVGPMPVAGGVPMAGATPAVVAPPVVKAFACFSSDARRGLWTVAPTMTASAVLGDVVLDLRQAQFTARETVIRCYSTLGSIKIAVNALTHVVVDGTNAGGQFKVKPDLVPAQLGPDSPVVRITGYAVLGDVVVQRKPMPEERRRGLWRRRRRWR